jgi:tRNA threonylcarbamoyladenosine biosynthesis protein TsaE
MDSVSASFRTHSAEESRSLGRRLGASLGPGSVVALRGELGSGKTVMAQGVASGLGFSGYVSSPSFVIVNEYAAGVPIYHVDLYRVEGPESLGDIGHREMFWGDGVAIVEWAERAGDLLPSDRLDVAISIVGPESRVIDVTALGERSAPMLRALVAAWAEGGRDADSDD